MSVRSSQELLSRFGWPRPAANESYRDGLIKADGPYQGSGRVGKTGIGGAWLRGIGAQEVLLLGRDRNLFVQVFIVPLLIPAYYLLTDSNLRSALTGNFCLRRGGNAGHALKLMSSAMPLLIRENKTLWQLLSFPRSLVSIFAEKSIFWAFVALLYGGTILFVIVHFSTNAQVISWSHVVVALYGIVLVRLYRARAWGSRRPMLWKPIRERKREPGTIVYLYFRPSGDVRKYPPAPSRWTGMEQSVLSALLAFALLGRRSGDTCPTYWTPIQWPPRTPSAWRTE